MEDISSIINGFLNFQKDAGKIFTAQPSLYPIKAKGKFETAIITASYDEFDKVKSLLKDCTELNIQNDTTIFYSGTLKKKNGITNVILPVPMSMGMAATITLTTKVLTYFNPDYMFMLGICAGNKNVTKIGDVIIAEKSLNYNEIVEIEKKDETTVRKFMQNADSIDKKLKTRLTLFSRKPIIKEIRESYKGASDFPEELNCRIGLMVSGSSLIRSDSKISDINSSYHNVKGLDMETHGFYYAASNTFNDRKPLFVSIKSVSDFGDNTKHKISSAKRKDYALHTSTQTLIKFIETEI